jgi:carbon dioxide concentrating mechanism protein CcmN
MPLLQLPSINNSQVCVMGDVSIDENVAIASGVILQADANCRLIIHAGVCIGMGTILHAHHGNVEIQSGVVLGAGVLIVGKAKIGDNACIGSTTTIWNTDVAPDRIVPPGSVVGSSGREITEITQKEISNHKEISSHIEPIQQLPQSTFVPPSPPILSTFVPPSVPPLPVSSTFVQPSPPPPITSTFVPPAPMVPPLVSSPFIQPTPSPQVQSTFVDPNSPLTSSNSTAIDSSETSQDITQENAQETSEESGKEEPQNNNHQFYGQNRISQLLGTLMPQNKPLS